ncbi:hypothetical protein G7046_g8945 [Stylonectria norvegica]|nr:hypothetical protein G7046_g8945 [Stylonectria norvegica]
MSEFDPSVPKPGETRMTAQEAEEAVSLAYGVAMLELDVLLKMVSEVAKPPGDKLDDLKKYRDVVVQDVRRIGLRLNLSKKYLKTRDSQFHYHAKRLRTKDRIDRLRLWDREKQKELEACRIKSGAAGYEQALRSYDETKRVMIRCYKLETLWERAMKREMSAATQGDDDLSSSCETSMEE